MNPVPTSGEAPAGATSPVRPIAPSKADIQAVLARGLKNLWYPICPSHFVAEQPVSLRRLGLKLAVWRDMRDSGQGKVYALEDHCPHRGAPLSQGANLGDRLACPYHGIEVRCDGTVTKVPASPECALVGERAARSFHVVEAHGAVWLYNSASFVETPPPLNLPRRVDGYRQLQPFPVLYRVARRLPLCDRQRDGPDARHVFAQAEPQYE